MSYKTIITTFHTLLIALLIGACGASKDDKNEKSLPEAPQMPTPPAIMTDPTERAGFMITGLFEGVKEIDTTMFANDRAREEWLSDFLGIGSKAEEKIQRSAMNTFFTLATPVMDSIALKIGTRYLGYPNSPIFNEGRLILMLEEANRQGLLDTAEQVRLEDRKMLFNRNKVGFKAEDFTFQDPNGVQHTLYNSYKGKELLLVFYNPDCGTCKSFMKFLNTSETIRAAVNKGLKVLCIYAGNDEEEWYNNLNILPKFAQAGHDAEQMVLNESLYDLKAMPTAYLLDFEKKVILKDAFPEDIEKYLSNNNL